jgi:hypothetical protein
MPTVTTAWVRNERTVLWEFITFTWYYVKTTWFLLRLLRASSNYSDPRETICLFRLSVSAILNFCGPNKISCLAAIRMHAYRKAEFLLESCNLYKNNSMWGPLSLVSTTEELLERKNSGFGIEIRDLGRGDPLRWLRDIPLSAKADTNFADKWRSLGRYSSLVDSGHGFSFIRALQKWLNETGLQRGSWMFYLFCTHHSITS